MLIIPAMHLKNGQCVRFQHHGPLKDAIILSENPTAMIEHWVKAGAKKIHLIDLENDIHHGISNKPKNLPLIHEILATVKDIPVQLSGGIRTLEKIEQYLDAGLQHIVIGAAAIKTPGFLHEACDAFPGHIIVGLDAKNGIVVTDGWTKTTQHDVLDLAKRFEDYGVEAIIYTDVGPDGDITHVNIDATVKLAETLHIPVIASGDLTHLDDIRALCSVAHEGISSIIARGYRLDDNGIDLTSAQALADELSTE